MQQNSKLARIRELLTQNNLGGYLVPHNDAHDSEYIANDDERLAYISGFTGSAGTALITQEKALLWTDSRYFLQAEKELEQTWELRKLIKGVPSWFEEAATLIQGQNLAFDPTLINAKLYNVRKDKLEQSQINFKPLDQNLVDAVWENKVAPTQNKIYVHHPKFLGRNVQDKLNQVFEKSNGATSTLTANLAQIAWVLNLRGSDIDYNPVFKSYLYLLKQQETFQGTLYIDQSKITTEVNEHLKLNNITTKPYPQIFEDAKYFPQNTLINSSEINTRLFQQLQSPQNIDTHPIETLKSIKDQREIQGFRESHVRDGAALCRFLAWLENALVTEGRTDLDEYQITLVLEKYRRSAKDNAGLSFATISSSGPNAAVVHYHPREGNSSPVVREQIYLLDSGGQYYDGTTDVTRTMHFGLPTQEEKVAYTRVLLGNQDIEALKFPANSNIHGGDIDILARRWLWADNLDYGHGTGHGVGYFLCVHEGPNGISKYRSVPFVPGMIVSNEPGYYKDGSFGIRIENLIVVVDKGNNFWGFDNLTLCPYDRNLIDKNLLSQYYIDMINKYHQRVYEELAPQIKEFDDDLALKWLEDRTKPL